MPDLPVREKPPLAVDHRIGFICETPAFLGVKHEGRHQFQHAPSALSCPHHDPYRGSVWTGMDRPDFRCTKPAAASCKNVAQGFRTGNDGKTSIGGGYGCSGADPGLKQAIRHHMRIAAQAVGRGTVTRAIEGRVHDDEVEAVVAK